VATIRKLKNRKYIAEVRKAGQYKSKVFTTKIQAMAWAAETEQNLSSDTLVHGKTLGNLYERYRDEISPLKKSWKSERNRLNKFLRDPLAALPLVDIKQTYFYEWITKELTRIKSSSVNRLKGLNCFSSVFVNNRFGSNQTEPVFLS